MNRRISLTIAGVLAAASSGSMAACVGCRAPSGFDPATDAGPGCDDADDCSVPERPCFVATCIAGRCRWTAAAAGTPVSKDSPPDCRAVVCDLDGNPVSVVDSSNAPEPADACSAVTCTTGGEPTTSHVPFGFPCSNDGLARCNGFGACVSPHPADVLMHHNDSARTGLQSAETLLTAGNVDTTHFGMAFTLPVDDDVYAEPLYVADVDVGGAIHDAIYAATMNDGMYAFDADTGFLLWHTSLLDPGSSPLLGPFMLPHQLACTTITGNIGALATPAIDVAAGPHGTLYEVAETVDGEGSAHFRLHALDLSTGAERPRSPATLDGIQVDGEGVGGDGNGHVVFDPTFLFSRLSLLVANGRVYVGFSSICDQGPYHGWLLAYDEQTLSLVNVFNTTPDTSTGGLWEGGDGPATDRPGNLYVVTGNGPFNASAGGRDYGDSILKLSPDLEVLDYFTPHDAALLWEDDLDLGSAGVTLLPGTTLLAHVSKTDTLRLVDTTHMGHFNAASDSQIVQELALGPTPTPANPTMQHQGQSNPVTWVTAAGDLMVYFQTWQDPLRQYALVNGQLTLVAVNHDAPSPYYPGAGLSVSANGGTEGTGIVWGLAGALRQPGTLMAFDAADVSRTLWMSPASDGWLYLPHTKPTIAKGRVYVPTGSHEIVVYAGR